MLLLFIYLFIQFFYEYVLIEKQRSINLFIKHEVFVQTLKGSLRTYPIKIQTNVGDNYWFSYFLCSCIENLSTNIQTDLRKFLDWL